MKTCPGCKQTKDVSEFYKRRGDKPGSYCKACNRDYQTAYREQDPKADIVRRRGYQNKYVYGLSPEEVAKLPKECQVCDSTDRLHIDHDHFTGKVRGILCFSCNLGVGRFQDNSNLLIRAADYLMRHRNQREV